MNLKAVIFDLDGTLLNTLTSLSNCYNRVLQHNGYKTHPADDYKQFIGNGAMRCLIACLEASQELFHTSSVELNSLLEQQLMDYQENWMHDVEIYPGIESLLQTLNKRDFSMGVLSNKDHDFVDQCVNAFFDSSLFRHSQGYSNTVPHKPDPTGALQLAEQLQSSPESIAMIGDTRVDIETAKAAGFKSIGVLWGFRDRAELEDAGADFIVSQPNEILDLPGLARQ